MSAQVIRMDSVPRSALASSFEEAEMRGLRKALNFLDATKQCNVVETKTAIQNLMDAGLISVAEADEFYRYHGWGRN